MDVECLYNALDGIKKYIFISSSAIYPETLSQPFKETQEGGYNSVWKDYGMNKLMAEKYILDKIPNAYILRPPYLYGPMENLYRAAFVFESALRGRKFYVPNNGEMQLQFFHVQDLCKFIDIMLEKEPQEHIFNVGNEELISIKDWVGLCYEVAGRKAELVNVESRINQRNYFCFNDYEYELDVSRQKKYYSETKNMYKGFEESFQWYLNHKDEVQIKPYFDYIDKNLLGDG